MTAIVLQSVPFKVSTVITFVLPLAERCHIVVISLSYRILPFGVPACLPDIRVTTPPQSLTLSTHSSRQLTICFRSPPREQK